MFSWIADNISTIIVCAVLAVIVGAVVVTMIMDRKKGKSSCGCGGCTGCHMEGKCKNK